jgi:hypothetical protein
MVHPGFPRPPLQNLFGFNREFITFIPALSSCGVAAAATEPALEDSLRYLFHRAVFQKARVVGCCPCGLVLLTLLFPETSTMLTGAGFGQFEPPGQFALIQPPHLIVKNAPYL